MSIADDLSRLHELHQRGGLTEAEFMLAKARVLGESAAEAGPRPSRQGDGVKAAVIALLVGIAILAAPIAYNAFAEWVFRNADWKLFGS